MYAKYIKRLLDVILSFLAISVLSPVFLALIMLGAVMMKGNPFFTQLRPGKDERIFRLIKFRTMTNKCDENGKLLPDTVRLNKYGRFLRASSLDELPELLNILIGDMSIVGPRPLVVSYLPYYTEEERHRHDARPGLTGLAQINGRNAISWEEKFAYDVKYVNAISFAADAKIIFGTVMKVLKKDGINQGEKRPVSLHIDRAEMAKETVTVEK